MQRAIGRVVLFVFVFMGSWTLLYAVDCPHPAVQSVSLSPGAVIGGIGATTPTTPNDFTATITFAGTIPQGCSHFLLPSRNPAGAGLNPFFCTGFLGDGTNIKKCPVPTQVVDAVQTGVTVSFQARTSQAGSFVGNAVSSQAVTINPVKILSFTVSATQLANGQSATGTILLEGVVSNTTNAKVNISANPATAVTVPSSLTISCCSFDGNGHSKGTFTITGKAVAADTNVVISVKRPNQTAKTRNILVKH